MFAVLSRGIVNGAAMDLDTVTQALELDPTIAVGHPRNHVADRRLRPKASPVRVDPEPARGLTQFYLPQVDLSQPI